MIKIVIFICRLMSAQACTQDAARATVLADHQDDGTPCRELGLLLLKQLDLKPKPSDVVVVGCEKDGKGYY